MSEPEDQPATTPKEPTATTPDEPTATPGEPATTPGEPDAAAQPDDAALERAAATRMLRIILVLLLAAGGAVLTGFSQVWHTTTVDRPEPLPPTGASATGGDLVPLGVGIGVLLLASVVAVAATRGLGRRAIAVVLAIGVVWLGVLTTWTLLENLDAATIDDGTQVDPAGLSQAGLFGPILAYAGIVVGVVAAVLLWTWATRLPRMGERYERDGGSKPTGEYAQERDRWKALDRGEDPTV